MHEAVGGVCADVLGCGREGLIFPGNSEHLYQPMDASITTLTPQPVHRKKKVQVQ